VARGYVSADAAVVHYGVVLDDAGGIDVPASERRRAELAGAGA
jgi:hypothetical protein